MKVENFKCENCNHLFVRQLKKGIKCPKCRSLRVIVVKPVIEVKTK